MKKSKLIVIGSINNDLVIEVKKPPVMGETVLGGGFMQASGGKGANQAVAAARLGADVAFVGAVGDDSFGAGLLKNLSDNGVRVDRVKTARGIPTGTAMIIVCEGDNYIAVNPGANMAVDKNLLELAEAEFDSADMAVVQLEIPLETVRQAMKICAEKGIPVLLNPAPAQALDAEILSMADICTPNESETFSLTGILPATPEEAIEAAKRLEKMGAKKVVITLGGNGCVYGSEGKFKHAPAVNSGPVVDTTAAGDSFSAALAVALTEGKTLEQAVIFATKTGSVTVTRKGAQPSLPYRNELE
ncbi:MAG: ribokinase [Clostridiales bacterium]|jgi:ribokinase|nr:ribokinase [Clostridiales bacterium]